jgi:hypothetical protein
MVVLWMLDHLETATLVVLLHQRPVSCRAWRT